MSRCPSNRHIVETFQQLDLAGMINVMASNPVNERCIGDFAASWCEFQFAPSKSSNRFAQFRVFRVEKLQVLPPSLF